MASINFSSGTKITSVWLNDVDAVVWDVFGGATTAADARTALGLGNMALQAKSAVDITGGTIVGITDLVVADGGTGVSTMTNAYGVVCAGTTATGALQTVVPGTVGKIFTSGGAGAIPTWETASGSGSITASGYTQSTARLLGRTTASTGAIEEMTVGAGLTLSAGSLVASATGITMGTKQAASGTAIGFTGIAAGTKRITVNFTEVSTNGTSIPLIQLGDAGGYENTGYLATCSYHTAAANATDGFRVLAAANDAGQIYQGSFSFTLEDSSDFTWCCHGGIGNSTTAQLYETAGRKALSAELTSIQITMVNGTDAFDGGEFNIMTEA